MRVLTKILRYNQATVNAGRNRLNVEAKMNRTKTVINYQKACDRLDRDHWFLCFFVYLQLDRSNVVLTHASK